MAKPLSLAEDARQRAERRRLNGDVGLSTDLCFLPLVTPLATGHSDVAIGSRLLRGALVTREWKRELISRCYNLADQAAVRQRPLRGLVRLQGAQGERGQGAGRAGGG